MLMRRGEAEEMSELFKVLRSRERDGRFAGTPTVRLAQALLTNADPFAFLTGPVPASNAAKWPFDHSLDERLASQPSVVWTEEFAELMNAGLAPGTRLLAGVMRSYSRLASVSVWVEHMIPRPGYIGGVEMPPNILNGRSSLAYFAPSDLIATEPDASQVWLTRNIGGLFLFVNSNLEFFPGSVWRDPLCWTPMKSNPLVWMREDRRVAWYEQLSGPVRSGVRDFSYRQPSLCRWVCREDEWSRLESMLGRPERRTRTEQARDDQDA
jgi:hypothetical protein